MSTKTLANAADALNHFNVNAFPRKDGKGVTVSCLNTNGKRCFIDRMPTMLADGTTEWKWHMGKELAPREEQPAVSEELTVA